METFYGFYKYLKQLKPTKANGKLLQDSKNQVPKFFFEVSQLLWKRIQKVGYALSKSRALVAKDTPAK